MRSRIALSLPIVVVLILGGIFGIVPSLSLHDAYAKPPDWAPAHGYRRKHKDRAGDEDREEWKKKIEEELEDRFPNYREFLGLDENRDGKISRSEWEEGDDLFDKLDRNNDGVISRAEYARIDEERGALDRFFAGVKEKISDFWAWLF